jgi:hypothetical protein
MQILKMIPMCLANSAAPVFVTTSAAAATAATRKAHTLSITYNAGNSWKQTPSSSSDEQKNSSVNSQL